MANIKEIKSELESLGTLGVITRAFSQIASTQMLKTREKVLSARAFMNSINDIFYEVISEYRTKIIKKARAGKKKGEITFLAHNGKSVVVLLSANTGLYGQVLQDTYNMFASAISKGNSEVTIVGKFGLGQFLSEEPGRPYTYFDFPDRRVLRGELNKLITHLVAYEDISVFYPKFINVLKQVPTIYTISANTPIPNENLLKLQKSRKMHIYEPNIENIMVFFETEIFGSAFEQSFAESELARYASRMIAMDTASEKIKNTIGKLKVESVRASHLMANKKQLNSLITKMAMAGAI